MSNQRNTDMNIVVVGAGAIGSLFGGLLSKKNTVVLVGRTPHVNAIQQNGLHITGKTHLQVKLSAVDSIHEVTIAPDLILLTVKSLIWLQNVTISKCFRVSFRTRELVFCFIVILK